MALQDKRAEKDFFDEFASHGAYDVLDERGYRRIVHEFLKLVKPREGQSFLDIGCGTGAFTGRLARLSLEGVGLDLSRGNLDVACRHLPAVSFVAGDTELLPFADNSFDVVTFSGILHHLPSLKLGLREGWRVLKPGGSLFAYDPNGRNPAMWLYRSPRSPVSSRKGVTVNERLLTAEELESALMEAGFANVASVGVSGIPYTYVAGFLVRKLLTLYNLADLLLDKTPLARHIGSFLISFGRKPSREESTCFAQNR